MLIEKDTSSVNSAYYSALKDLETQELMLSDKYLKFLSVEALLNDATMNIGNKIPSFLGKNFKGQ